MSPVSKNTTGQLICETAATVWLSLSVSRPMHACVMVPDTARSTNQTSTFTPLPFIVFHMTSLMWDVRCVPRCANWHEMATSSYWINLSQIRLSKLCFYVMDNFCPYWGGGGSFTWVTATAHINNLLLLLLGTYVYIQTAFWTYTTSTWHQEKKSDLFI